MRLVAWVLAAICLGTTLGCGSAEPPKPAAEAKGPVVPPEKVVFAFLEAVRTGDDATATKMLSPLARQRTSEKELEVAPPGSDTASFKVGEVEAVGDGGAHVASTWTDLDDEGKPHSDQIVWMVRQEDEGWRIVGMATRLFPDQPPLFLNFEDPDDMIRKQQLAQQEIERRAQGGAPEAIPTGDAAAQAPRNVATQPPAQSAAGATQRK